MDNISPTDHSFNQQDYECVIRLYNGVHDVYLSNNAWDELYIEENIFDIFTKGTIIVKTPYDSLERVSDYVNLIGMNPLNTTYKFRNDCRDTLYIAIKPKSDEYNFVSEKWLIELETVIYDVQDLPTDGAEDKSKKLFFIEKTGQMMAEKNHEFSTANTGSNANKTGQDQASDEERKLLSGEAILELLRSDPMFKQHVTDRFGYGDTWNKGHAKHKVFWTTAANEKFIETLSTLSSLFISDKGYPGILKLERSGAKGKPRQFSLKALDYYFSKAGKKDVGDYQQEHFFLEEPSYDDNAPILKKSPITSDSTREVKADEYNRIRNFKLVDLAGKDYADNLCPRNILYYNSTDKQWILDCKDSSIDTWKNFYKDIVAKNVMTDSSSTQDRLPITPYMKNRVNYKSITSVQTNSTSIKVDGTNKLLNYYIFSNLSIAFTVRGLTLRQPGRFFAISKEVQNDKEFDHKLEGQYFAVNILHHFSTASRGYYTEITGVKTHTYREETQLPQDDVLIINKASAPTAPLPANLPIAPLT